MRNYEILPHTADLRLRVFSETLEGMFEAALEGMNKIITGDSYERNSALNTDEVVEIFSIDESMLLIDFLSEVLTLTQKNKRIYKVREIAELGSTHLKIALTGAKIDGFDEDIKAVTYTEAKIVKNAEGIFETIIVFDI